MMFLGLGLRKEASLGAFLALYRQLSLPPALPIAISAHLEAHAMLPELAAMGHEVRTFPLADLAQARCLTQSPRILALHGVGSLAEAAAWWRAQTACLAGQYPVLKRPRQVSSCRSITLAIAHIGDPS